MTGGLTALARTVRQATHYGDTTGICLATRFHPHLDFSIRLQINLNCPDRPSSRSRYTKALGNEMQ